MSLSAPPPPLWVFLPLPRGTKAEPLAREWLAQQLGGTADTLPLLRDGRVKPVMDSTFPLEKAADAHRRMETSEHIGKIVLAV